MPSCGQQPIGLTGDFLGCKPYKKKCHSSSVLNAPSNELWCVSLPYVRSLVMFYMKRVGDLGNKGGSTRFHHFGPWPLSQDPDVKFTRKLFLNNFLELKTGSKLSSLPSNGPSARR
jgi:hypothetical protein